MRILVSCVFILILNGCALRQAVPVVNANTDNARKTAETAVLHWVGRLPHALEIDADTVIPSRKRAAAFQTALQAVVSGDMNLAGAAANLAGYQVVIFSFGDVQYVALADRRSPGVGPTVIVNTHATRNIIAVTSPLVFHEGVDIEAGLFITRLEARAVILAGAHICASLAAGNCQVAQIDCAGHQMFIPRPSDEAQQSESLYQLAHEILFTAWPESIFFGLHGLKTAHHKVAIIADGGDTSDGIAALPGRIRDSIGKIDPALKLKVFGCNSTLQNRWARFVRLDQGDKVLDVIRPGSVVNLAGSTLEKILRSIAASIPSSDVLRAPQDSSSDPVPVHQ